MRRRTAHDLTAALAWQTPEHRDVVRVAHDEGMTTREIDTAKDLPVATITSRAWYAMRSLGLALEQMEAVA
jgi:RNA polymerase sigma-70 factor, ECF subfamily